jgi:hypothetical protein
MPMPKHDKIGGFLAFALAVTAATATPEAHAGLLDDIKRDFEYTYRSAANDTARSTLKPSPLTPRNATVTQKVAHRVVNDVSSVANDRIYDRRDIMGNRRGKPLGDRVSDSVSDVANDTAQDLIRDTTSTGIS